MHVQNDLARCGTSGATVDLGRGLDLPGFAMSFSRNEEIFGEQEPADFVYQVVEGVARTMRVLSDGRRQISAFHLPGDVFGIELSDTHRFSAEAVTECKIALVRRPALDRAIARDTVAALSLWALTSQTLAEAQEHILLLTRRSAAERVAAFLLAMAETSGDGRAMDLPMSRLDIADYLGLTIETVSRTLTQFERDGVIALPSCRHVIIRDRGALEAGHD